MQIILMRHAEAVGNVDELAYCRVPDHALPLTATGQDQARLAGRSLSRILATQQTWTYCSPYVRALDTLRLLDHQALFDRLVVEPRLREQDWGNLQDPHEQQIQKQLRHQFGHFFYRLPFGESGADVDDRVAAFLSDLRLERQPKTTTVFIVSHGLTIRLLCRRLFGWSIDLFESLSNLDPCEYRIASFDGAQWTLDRPFRQWRISPDGTSQETE